MKRRRHVEGFESPFHAERGRPMKDLMRSPLQFVRPMTDSEWQDLMSRARDRERQRVKRRQPHAKNKPVEPRPRARGSDQLMRSAFPASL